MKRLTIFMTILVSCIAAVILYIQKEEVQESIIFFPLDSSVVFKEATTSLLLSKEKDNDEHVLEWNIISVLDREVYLRQDISLLFSDGRLKAVTSEWEDNSQKIAQYKQISGEDSSHYVSISYHHGEIHINEDQIKSSQRMSHDHLYVIDSSFSPLESFREPNTNNQKEWKKVLDHATDQQLNYILANLTQHFQLPTNQYHIISLTDLAQYNNAPLFGMSEAKTQETIGKLWEGLYKNYFLGIKLQDGTIVEPIGSSEPHLLISKDLTHLLVLFQTNEGQPIKLIQNLPRND